MAWETRTKLAIGTLDAVLKAYKKKSINIDHPNNKGETPLHVAAKIGFNTFAEKLIEKGALITAKDNTNETPLHKAVEYPSTVNSLLRIRKQDIKSIINLQNKDGDTALHKASRMGQHLSVNHLIKQDGIDTKICNNDGKTALHVTVNDTVAAKLVTKDNELLRLPDKNGDTVFHIAAKDGKNEVIEKLIVYMNDTKYMTKEDRNNLLNKSFNQKKRTPLLVAMMKKHDDIIR